MADDGNLAAPHSPPRMRKDVLKSPPYSEAKKSAAVNPNQRAVSPASVSVPQTVAYGITPIPPPHHPRTYRSTSPAPVSPDRLTGRHNEINEFPPAPPSPYGGASTLNSTLTSLDGLTRRDLLSGAAVARGANDDADDTTGGGSKGRTGRRRTERVMRSELAAFYPAIVAGGGSRSSRGAGGGEASDAEDGGGGYATEQSDGGAAGERGGGGGGGAAAAAPAAIGVMVPYTPEEVRSGPDNNGAGAVVVASGGAAARERARRASSSGGGGGPPSPPTELHALCSSPAACPDDIGAALHALGPGAASLPDARGRRPLHLLSANAALIQSALHKARREGGARSGIAGFAAAGRDPPASPELESLITELVRADPTVVTCRDDDGRLPFTYALREWVHAAAKPGLVGAGHKSNTSSANSWHGNGIGGAGSLPTKTGPPVDLERLERNWIGGKEEDPHEPPVGPADAAPDRGEPLAAKCDEADDQDQASIVSSVTNNFSLPSAFRSMYSARPPATDGEAAGAAGAGLMTNAPSVAAANVDSGEAVPATRNEFRRNQVRQASNSNVPQVKDGGNGDAAWRDEEDTSVVPPPPPLVAEISRDATAGGGGSVGGSVLGGLDRSKVAPDKPAGTHEAEGGVARGTLHDNSNVHYTTDDYDDGSIDDVFPLNVPITPLVEWNLRILSALYDGADELLDPSSKKKGRYSGPSGRGALLAGVARIPSLVKTLLLSSESDPAGAKEMVLSLSIVKAVMISKRSIGNWLVYMLEAVDGRVASRAVDYLEYLSLNCCSSSPGGNGGSKLRADRNVRQNGEKNRVEVFDQVGRLEYFLPSLLALEDTSEVNRAASTRLVRSVLNAEIVRGWSANLALFDLAFNLLLLVSFNLLVHHFLEGRVYGSLHSVVPFYLCLFSVLYGISRRLGRMAATIKISRAAFRSNNFGWGDSIAWIGMGMALGGVAWMEIDSGRGNGSGSSSNYADSVEDGMRAYLAATIGMLWLKLLAWLCAANWEAAKFAQVLSRIACDIKWFLLSLTAAVVAFGEMFFVVVSSPSDCDAAFCTRGEVYLRTYAAALGQFDVNELTSIFSIVAFVLFSLVVLVLLFYTLIALVLESYSATRAVQSQQSGGGGAQLPGSRARLVYAAELKAHRRLLERDWNLLQYCSALLFVLSAGALFLFAMEGVRDSVGEYYGDAIVGAGVGVLLLFLLLSVGAFVSHMTYFDDTREGRHRRRSLLGRLAGSKVVMWLGSPVAWLIRVVLGVNNRCDVPSDIIATQMCGTNHLMGNEMNGNRAAGSGGESASMCALRQISAEMTDLGGRVRTREEESMAEVLAEVRASEARLVSMMVELRSMVACSSSDGSDHRSGGAAGGWKAPIKV